MMSVDTVPTLVITISKCRCKCGIAVKHVGSNGLRYEDKSRRYNTHDDISDSYKPSCNMRKVCITKIFCFLLVYHLAGNMIVPHVDPGVDDEQSSTDLARAWESEAQLRRRGLSLQLVT